MTRFKVEWSITYPGCQWVEFPYQFPEYGTLEEARSFVEGLKKHKGRIWYRIIRTQIVEEGQHVVE